jgi:hypothetical protein
MNLEKRKYVRFAAPANAFAAVRSGLKKVGKVHDISINGLGFSYLEHLREENPEITFSNVDIFLSDNRFHLSNVSCRVAHDTEKSSPHTSGMIKMNRCGLHFGKLTKDQSEQLDFFIKNYITGISS